jgi:pyruvate dehydrogenase E2 component (dihydrolipoamide acetyltransferase)
MAELFVMPRLGQSMEEGTVLQWFRQEGDSVKPGDPFVEVMSDKANFEVEATTGGILRKILVPANETVPVNAPLAIFGTADESIDSLLGGEPTSEQERKDTSRPNAEPSQPERPTPNAQRPTPSPDVFLSPRARRLAEEQGIALATLEGVGTGPNGRVIERDVVAYIERQKALAPESDEAQKTRITPLAAKIADDLGVNVGDLSQGLPGSRIMAGDVRRHAEAQKPVPASAATADGSPAIAEVIPFKGLRKLIADNVAKSRQTAPHVTLTLEVDMTEAAALLDKLKPEVQKAYSTKLTYTDLLVKATAHALEGHPLCNAALIGDEVRVYGDKNIGVAVATDTGLIVPVLRHSNSKPLGSLSVELKALVERCRTGKQTQDDITGGTFTITNLGAFGIDVFDPIIVPPQSCILGVGRIADKPVVVNKQIIIRPMMNLCLSFDHRVLDGVPAARFLQRLKDLLESPLLLFV